MRTILETERLILRELVSEDLNFVAAQLAHPEVMRFWPRTYSREEAVEWIERQRGRYVSDRIGFWLAVEKVSGAPIGQAGLVPQEVDGRNEVGIGYIIHRPYWRLGYATEAGAGCRDYGFKTLKRQRLLILVRPENTLSASVARKLGGQAERETMYRDYLHTVFVCAG